MSLLQDLTLLKSLSAFNAIWMSIVAGQALSLYMFSIPLIKEANGFPRSSLIMVRQFHLQIKFGIKYIQTGSRIQGFLLALQAYLSYTNDDGAIRERWWYTAAALAVGIQVAWYEVLFVFPTNDRLIEMEGMLEKVDEESVDGKVTGEVVRLLEKWRFRHIPRIAVPLICAGFLMTGLMF